MQNRVVTLCALPKTLCEVEEQLLDPRIARAFLADNGFPLEPHLLALATVGSHAYGTATAPEDGTTSGDRDMMGIVVPPIEYHIGLPRWSHWTMQRDELDVVLYSLEKTVRLLLNSNPNVMAFLWLRDEDYLYRHPEFDRLIAARHVFASKAAAETFSGYAYGQLKRMEAFDLERMREYETLTRTIEAAGPVREVLEADAAKLVHIATHWNLAPDLLARFRRLHKSHFSGYMGEKRKSVVRRYQYDVKNAAHLVRLLRMGREFVETGKLRVYRAHDAGELKAIRQGDWTLEQVKAEADRLFGEIERAKQNSALPPEPDRAAAGALLLGMHGRVLGVPLDKERGPDA